MDSKFKRARVDSPTRCPDRFANGQCPYECLPGLPKCPMHAGRLIAQQREEKARLYRLTQYRDRVNSLTDADEAKNIREEIGMMRMMLESIWNRCTDDNELLMYSSKISDLAVKIEKLVTSCNRLELSSGTLLDRSTVLNMATIVVNIVAKHISSEDILDSIGNEITDAVMAQSTIISAMNEANGVKTLAKS